MEAIKFLSVVIMVHVALNLAGCTAIDTVTDQGVKLQVAYCGLTTTSRAAVARQYLERLPEGYDIDIDCPGDRVD